jgi:hypothetical protein
LRTVSDERLDSTPFDIRISRSAGCYSDPDSRPPRRDGSEIESGGVRLVGSVAIVERIHREIQTMSRRFRHDPAHGGSI